MNTFKDIPIDRVKRRIKKSPKNDIIKFGEINTSAYEEGIEQNLSDLTLWYQYWMSLSDFRKRYNRCADYNRGRQLDKVIQNADGEWKTQKEIIREEGKTPVVINVIRDLVRTILGQYRLSPVRTEVKARGGDDKIVSEMLTLALHSALDINNITELDAQQLETFMLSGLAMSIKNERYYTEYKQKDLFVGNINPNMAFFNSDIQDPRGYDITTIGHIIDCREEDAIATYAKTPNDILALKEIFSNIPKQHIATNKGLSGQFLRHNDFYTPSDPSYVRLYFGCTKKKELRVWRKDPLTAKRECIKGDVIKITNEISKENDERIKYFKANGLTDEEISATLILTDIVPYEYFDYKVLTRTGHCLAHYESPFEHKSHPYTILARPLINGEVWGIVEDVLNLQDVINQNFMMFKWIVEASAKGLLLVPEDAIPKGMDINDFAEQWSKVGGVIKVKLKQGAALPQEVNARTNQNVKDLLDFSIQIVDKVSGIHGALKGEAAKSGTPSSLYMQQAQNASATLLNFFRNFESYVLNRDNKALKVIMQTYDTGRFVDAFGNALYPESKQWNKDLLKDVDYRMKLVTTFDNQVYRYAIDEQLTKLFEAGAIDVKMWLKKSSQPFAQEILNEIEAREQQAIQGQQQSQTPQQLLQQPTQNLINV